MTKPSILRRVGMRELPGICRYPAERTAELLRLEQLAEELQARSEEMRARTRSSKYFGKGRMLRAYPKLRHGEKHRSLDELRERLKYERRH